MITLHVHGRASRFSGVRALQARREKDGSGPRRTGPELGEYVMVICFSVGQVKILIFGHPFQYTKPKHLGGHTGVGSGGGGKGGMAPHFSEWGAKICLCPPPLSDAEFRDVPPTLCYVPTSLGQNALVEYLGYP